MNFYLLDAAIGGFILGFAVVAMIIVILIEAITLLLLKYNKAGKCFLDAFLINTASLVVGVVIAQTFSNGLDFTENGWVNVSLLFLISAVIEFGILYLLNMKKPISKTAVAAIVINVVSYLLLIGITSLMRKS